jgi:hypothetical protein
VAVIWSVGRKLHHPAPSSLGEEGGAEIN